MSDTDDTDDLLLIPPDFFVIHSDAEDSIKPYGPYYEVVDNLITQVNQLEDRINFIETASDSSFLSNSLDYIGDSYNKATALMSGVRKFNSWENIPKPEEVYVESTHSTPQKPRSRIKLHSLPSTPSTDRYIPLRSRQNSITSIQYGQGDRQYIPQTSNNTKHLLQNSALNLVVRNDAPGQVQKAQSRMLNEIDNFISNVKTIQKHNAVKNLNTQFDTCTLHENTATFQNTCGDSSTSKSGLNLNDVDQMLHAMESQQREIESRLKEKEHELGVNRGDIEVNEHHCKEKVWQQGDNKNTVPDRGMGMRDILYDDQYKSNENYKPPVQEDLSKKFIASGLSSQEPSATDLSARATTESIYSDNSPSLSSSDSTQLTAYQSKTSQETSRNPINVSSDSEKIHTDAMHILNMHRNLLSRTLTSTRSVENENQSRRQKPQNFAKSKLHSFQNDLLEAKSSNYEPKKNALALLSLSELWNNSAAVNDGRNHDHSKFVNKLEEEKLRRRHCEQLIQQLQTRILELQERLAVAVQVDQAKDDAIFRVHKSWEDAASKINSVTNERSHLEQQIAELKARSSFELSEATKKVNHYENELSKALNLAHNNQEKLIALEKQNMYLTTEIQSFQNKLKTAQGNYNTELDSNQQLSKILSQKEIELNENKNTLTEARKEVAQSKRAVEKCQAELTFIKDSQRELEQELHEALEHVKALEMDKAKLLADIEMHKKIEKTVQDDLNKQKDVNEKNKVELRNFYQDQVEIVVRDKLREFQSQLEKAENSLQDEIHSRELSIAKAAAVHIQQVTEKHALEVHLLEEKQKEEVKLYKLQLSQAHQQIENFQIKFQQQQERRSNIAQQLHKIMEAQWLEALKIINNGKSPVLSKDKGTNTIDQLNSLKSRSYNNLEEILFKDDTQGNKACGEYKIRKSKVPIFESVESMSSVMADDTYGRILLPVHQTSSETPVSSRPQKSRQQMENELQKYIQMLLSKSPGNPTEDQNSKYYEKFKNQLVDSNPDPDEQEQTDKLNPDGTKSNKMGGRDRSGKPPWK